MRLGIETLHPLEDRRWQPFIEASRDATIFHHRDWLSLLHEQYGYPIRAVCVVGPRRELIAAVPFAHVRSRLTGTRLVAIPFSDLCGPVTRDGESEAVGVLIESIRRQHDLDGVDLEIRAPISGLGRPGTRFYHHTVTLEPDVEAVRRRFDANVRRRVSKAQREGVEVFRATGRGALDEFYRLHLVTRRRIGVPVQPKRFVRRFVALFEKGLGFVLIARFRDQTIAANVFLSFNGVLIGKYNASDPSHLSKGPNNAMLMEAIRWGCRNGYRIFDLGRTDPDNDGLRLFKCGWGADECLLAYTHLSRHGLDASRHAVPPFARLVLRRSPPVVGRVVGATLYKHFG